MRTLFLLLVLLLQSNPALAAGTPMLRWIVWTNPSTNPLLYWVIDPGTGDSTLAWDCDVAGESLHDLANVRIWRWPITGGMPFVYTELNERGREGLADSTQVPEDAHYFITAQDTTRRNESCPSNIVYLGPITGVPTYPATDAIVRQRVFDVQGRLIRKPKASGIYFYKAWWRSGRVTTGKLPVVLR